MLKSINQSVQVVAVIVPRFLARHLVDQICDLLRVNLFTNLISVSTRLRLFIFAFLGAYHTLHYRLHSLVVQNFPEKFVPMFSQQLC